MAHRQSGLIPFNSLYLTGQEAENLAAAMQQSHWSGNGPFGRRCEAWLEDTLSCHKALLTPSCTAALEMVAMLIDTQPGDEIIMPSFTFVSTANAFALRGGVPVFVDICPDVPNIDVSVIEQAITAKTKAIVVVHYGGIACDMDAVMDIACAHDLIVIEDAAHAILAKYKGRHLGSIGHLATLSFHETKNITCGEGGALLINDPRYVDRAHIIRDKGTDRFRFSQGMVDKYTWQDVGSSYLMNELSAAFLYAQMEKAQTITDMRKAAWNAYYTGFSAIQDRLAIHFPDVPGYAEPNAHNYYVLLPSAEVRTAIITYLHEQGISAHFHYIPLHASKAGQRYGRTSGSLARTEETSQRLLRLPLWVGIEPYTARVIQSFERGMARIRERAKLT